MATVSDIHLKGVDASKPSASIAGRLYFASDTLKVYRDNGSSWDDVTPTAGAGTGTVTHTGTLTSGQLIKGNGTVDITVGDLTGDVTTSGGVATTLANIPTGAPMAGSLLATNITAPSTPASGKDSIYVDSTDKRLHDKNDAGSIGTTVVADTGSSNNFLTAISAAGVISKAQPTEANLSTSDITTNNVSSTKHGLTPKSPADATQFLNGAATPAFAAVKDSDLATTDITTNNVSTSKHGFAPKAPNDATKFLDGTGAYSVPAGGGGLVLLEHHTASSSASLSFTTSLSSTYDHYLIVFDSILPATDTVNLNLKFSTDGGSTYDGTSIYSWSQYVSQIGAISTANAAALNTSSMQIGGSIKNTSTNPLSGRLELFGVNSTSALKSLLWDTWEYAGSAVYRMFGGGYYNNTSAAINAFQVLFSSGNIASGSIYVYGFAKS